PSFLCGTRQTVIPAKAGIHFSASSEADRWIPAFAGMTRLGRRAEAVALLGLGSDHDRGGAGANPAQHRAAPPDRRSGRARRHPGALLLRAALRARLAAGRLAGADPGPAIARHHDPLPAVDGR